MTVTTSGPAQLMSGLATLLAATAQFRSDTNTTTTADALDFTHWPEASDTDAVRPRAIIRQAQGWKSDKLGVGTHGRTGTLELTFEYPTHSLTDTEADQLAVFSLAIDTIIGQMEALAGVGDAGDGNSYLNVTAFTESAPLGKDSPQGEDGETYFVATYLVEWQG